MILLLRQFVVAWLFLATGSVPAVQGLVESERIQEYEARNYTWPINKFVPDTPGWRRLMQHRLRQVAEIRNDRDRYEGYVQVINQALLAPNFTEYGFGLVRAPEDLMVDLRQAIEDGLARGPKIEKHIDVIETVEPSWMIERPDLIDRVLKELHDYPETWSQTELKAWGAYGFRLYRNNSKLHMHLDRAASHIVSFILHIASSEDAEPWPIVIEDLHGRTHEVILTSGDMLLYESSKCLHGRPKRFNGSWYSSVFAHYYPIGWDDVPRTLEKHYAVPPEWSISPTTNFEFPLEMLGTGMREPLCEDEWCQLKHSKRWSGPGIDEVLMTPGGENLPFHVKERLCHDYDERCSDWAQWETNECERNHIWMKQNCKQSCGYCSK